MLTVDLGTDDGGMAFVVAMIDATTASAGGASCDGARHGKGAAHERSAVQFDTEWVVHRTHCSWDHMWWAMVMDPFASMLGQPATQGIGVPQDPGRIESVEQETDGRRRSNRFLVDC